MPARLNDSFQASEREASRLQCSVERIWSRIAGVTGVVVPVGASAGPGVGAGSAPMPGPAPVGRSNDIGPVLLRPQVCGQSSALGDVSISGSSRCLRAPLKPIWVAPDRSSR